MRFFNFLFGIAIGVGVGMLLAPQSGRRSRALIKDKAVKYSNDTADFVDKKSRHIANVAKGYAHNVSGKVSGIVSRGQDVMEEQQEEVAGA